MRRSLRDAKKFVKSEKAAEAQAAAAPAAAASGSSSAADADEQLIGAGDSSDGSSSSDSSIDSSDSDSDDADDADGGSDGNGGDAEGASKRRELAVLAKVRTTIKRGPLPSKAGDLRKAAKARGELLSEMRVSLVRSEDKNDRKDETIEELRASLKAVHEENAKLRTVAIHAVEAAEEAHDKLEVYEDVAAILADAGLRNYPLEYSNALCSGRLCASPGDFGMRVRAHACATIALDCACPRPLAQGSGIDPVSDAQRREPQLPADDLLHPEVPAGGAGPLFVRWHSAVGAKLPQSSARSPNRSGADGQAYSVGHDAEVCDVHVSARRVTAFPYDRTLAGGTRCGLLPFPLQTPQIHFIMS